ncbi:MAG: hypothetical protein IPN76_31710 [Saprospiraceae bacterium]|nr:hypothetical protein [Saprospiraceae bacterium]
MTGGTGSCGFDGFNAYTTWSLNADETELTLNYHGVFTPDITKQEVYRITEATTSTIKSISEVDLTDFGGIKSDWNFEWSAKAK